MSSVMARVHAGTHLLTIEQVAERLRFSTHTIRKWVKQRQCGFPQPVRIGQRREWRWRETDLAESIEANGHDGCAPEHLFANKPLAALRLRVVELWSD